MKWPKWVHVISFTEGRKVGFGIWLFLTANTFLAIGKIDAEVWLKCAFVSGALIGFGTILDAVVQKLADKWAGANAPQPPSQS